MLGPQQLQENGSFGQIYQPIQIDQPTMFSPSYDCQDLSDDDVEHEQSIQGQDSQLQNQVRYSTVPQNIDSYTLDQDNSTAQQNVFIRASAEQDSQDQVIHQTPSQIKQDNLIDNIFQPDQSQYNELLQQMSNFNQAQQHQQDQQPVKKYKLSNQSKLGNNSKLLNKSIKWTKSDLVYEKLSQNNKPYYIEVARLIKDMEEKQRCTFKPQVNQEGRRYQDPQELFERLYYEKNLKQDLNNRREQIKAAKEVHGCSFTPQRLTKDKYESNQLTKSQNSKQLFEKLYQDHEHIQKSRQNKKLALDQIEQQGLTFTPTIFTKSRGSQQQISSLSQVQQQKHFETLYQDSSRRREKIFKLQQDKDKEIQNSHNLTFKKRSNSVSGPTTTTKPEISINDNTNKENNNSKSNIKTNEQKPRYIDLYEYSLQRKERMRKLEKEVNLERGITFTPNKFTNTSYKGQTGQQLLSNSARSLSRSLQLNEQRNNSTTRNNDQPLNIRDLKHSNNAHNARQKLPPKPISAKPKRQ
eukprot:403340642